MGNFFTSTQIYNPKQLDRDKFIDLFCKEMKKTGYIPSNSDECEISYILRFDDNCKWVAITSEAYEQGNRFSQADTGRIAKMLKTVCINTTVIDSDCASLDLYDESGNKKDSLIMGRADDYFGDDIPEPSESVWTPFLKEGCTWRQLLDVLNGDYVFVEEGLTELSHIFGLDSEGRLFLVDSDNDNEHNVSLYFKKNAAVKEKKLTLNAAIKQVFGEILFPLGFKRVKSSYPYYVRVVAGEIVHVVSVINQKNNNANQIMIIAGIATVYRRKIDFSTAPQAHYNYWLFNSYELCYKNISLDKEYDKLSSIGNFSLYVDDSNDIIIVKLQNALNDVVENVIPILDEVNNFDSAADFLLRYSSSAFFFRKPSFDKGDYLDSNESLLLTAISDTSALLDRYGEYLKVYNDYMVSINRVKRQYDIPKSLDELVDKINCLQNSLEYVKIANEYCSSNKAYLCNLFKQ